MPAGITNRAADNWRPLLAIAEIAGGEWPEHANRIAEGMVNAAVDDDNGSIREMLLTDIRTIIEARKAECISSVALTNQLQKMEGRPWPEWAAGKPMSPNALARQLKAFGIAPSLMRIAPAKTPCRGYRCEQFTMPSRATCPLSEPLHRYKAQKTGKLAPQQPLHNTLQEPLHANRRHCSRPPTEPSSKRRCERVAVRPAAHP